MNVYLVKSLKLALEGIEGDAFKKLQNDLNEVIDHVERHGETKHYDRMMRALLLSIRKTYNKQK